MFPLLPILSQIGPAEHPKRTWLQRSACCDISAHLLIQKGMLMLCPKCVAML